MGQQRYDTTVSYKPQGAGEAIRMTSIGQAIVETFASFVFAGAGTLALLILGTLLWAGLHRTWIWSNTGASNRLLLLATVPWFVLVFRLIFEAWGALRLMRGERRYAATLAQNANAWAPSEPVRDAHLVPVYMPESQLDGVPISVIVEFIDQLRVRGHTSRAWINSFTFRNGKMCDYQTWSKLCGILEKGGILQDREERKSGYLVTDDPDEVLARLRLSQYAHLLSGNESVSESNGRY